MTSTILGDSVKKKNEPVADAAWRKRLGLDYNQKLLPQNPDGSVSLPENNAAQIQTDTTAIKNRINDMLKFYPGFTTEKLKEVDPDRYKVMSKDQDYLNKLREMYKGKPVVVNEYQA